MSEETREAARPSIYEFLDNPIAPERIEEMSFEAIDRERGEHNMTPEQWVVTRRMIHTTADFGMIDDVRFSDGAIESGIAAFRRKCQLYSDSNMIRAGISAARLSLVNPGYTKDDVHCYIADPEVAKEAKAARLPRSLYAARRAKNILDGGVAVIGNAPVALMEISRMIAEDGVRPALVIAMPVGFIHVVESKRELMSLDIPYIALDGRRGGSALAVSVVHSLLILAGEHGE
ncbi:MAG: precorrin-8X methylmutase [Nitrospinota bacterium]|nr:precorrin-8X methylmutase [Nitrospinota bacterium]